MRSESLNCHIPSKKYHNNLQYARNFVHSQLSTVTLEVSDVYRTERALVEAAKRGDRRSLRAIMHVTERLVAQVIQRMITGPEDRKDLVQDTYTKAFNNLAGFKHEAKLSTWVARIAYNTCINFLEKKKVLLTGESFDDIADTGSAEQMVQDKELNEILSQAIDELPPIYKTVFVLFHKEELSISEVCDITSLPEGTVKSHLFRARKKLKQIILSKYKNEL